MWYRNTTAPTGPPAPIAPTALAALTERQSPSQIFFFRFTTYQPPFDTNAVRLRGGSIRISTAHMSQTSVIYFINTPSEIDYVLYRPKIDVDLASQHHILLGL